jgi:GH24 family phage-related lysozyme (muramidase)
MFLFFVKLENVNDNNHNMGSSFRKDFTDSLVTYNNCINELKVRETFVDKIYTCPAGYKTIGYGHRLVKGERYRRIDSLEALTILKNDFNKVLTEVNNKYNDSTYKWKLAHAHASFCLGFSRVVKAIKNKDLHKHVYYRKNNRYVKSKSLVKAREFELALINEI